MQALRESERRLQLSQKAAGIAALELDIATGTVYRLDRLLGPVGAVAARRASHISVLENIVLPEDKHVRSTPETRADGNAPPPTSNTASGGRTPARCAGCRATSTSCTTRPASRCKMFGVMQDITERKEAQARQKMLTHELEHRIKNILAMVSAIASQTLRNTDIDSARVTFNERLRALANAHDILNTHDAGPARRSTR